jgi:methyl-accepting chemotaxis protein
MARFSLNPLRPGVLLMRSLRMPLKLGALGVLLLAPLVAMTVAHYGTLDAERRLATAERDGARLVGAADAMIVAVQVARGMTARAASGDAAALRELPGVRQAVRDAMQAFSDRAAATRTFAPPAEWSAVRDAVDAIAQGRVPASRDAAFDAHTEVVESLRQLIVRIGEGSGLLLDPIASTYYLMDVPVQRMVPLIESLALVRGRGAALIARGEATLVERARVLGAAVPVERLVADVAASLEAARRAGVVPPAGLDAVASAAKAYAQRAIGTFSSDAVAGDAKAFFDEGTVVIAAAGTLNRAVLERLVAELDARAGAARRALIVDTALASAAVAAVAWLGWAFWASFAGALGRLHRGVDVVAAGNLAHSIQIDGRDEMAEIARFVDRMSDRLSSMVAEIRSSAMRVGMAGHALAEDSAALSRRSAEMAASLRGTLDTARALSEAVAANAASAGELDRLTGRLREDAEKGGLAMRETVESMTRLQSSSRRVGEIVSVIDGIAFQTNILALNAAVEAARAGEQGRGFAVVAAEVRTLAQRSAAAAREIKDLIAQSTSQVEGSVSRIHHVGGVLDSLVGGVRTASERLRELAAASARQSGELEQVARSVGDLDAVTRDNAAIVEKSTAASRELVARAKVLTGAVSSIRLRQGSADEATALVGRALELVRANGLAGASPTLHSAQAGFVDRDLYVFVIDREGRYRIHGAKPEMEGRRVHEVPGIDGDRFLRDAWAAAEAGSGWIDYDIVNPKTGAVQPKTSYIVGLDASLLIGCGVYRRVDALAQQA